MRDEFVEDRDNLETVLVADLLSTLEKKGEGLYLDLNLNTSERQCQEINDPLVEKNLFLRVYEMRKKIKFLIRKCHTKNEVKRELSACIEERYNGFDIVRNLMEKKK